MKVLAAMPGLTREPDLDVLAAMPPKKGASKKGEANPPPKKLREIS